MLDEPANGLDPAGIRELRGYLRQFAHDQNVTVFLSSHVLNEVEQVGDWIGIKTGEFSPPAGWRHWSELFSWNISCNGRNKAVARAGQGLDQTRIVRVAA